MFGFFKSKKEFNDAVQKEVDRREKEKKQQAEESWDKWLDEHPVEVRLSKKNELKVLFTQAEDLYKAHKYNEAFELLNKVLEGYTEVGEIVGLYVFILIIDVQKALEGKEGALWAYDLGISYYEGVSGEYVDQWREHLIVAKDSFIKEEQVKEELQKKYHFPLDEPMITALKRLDSIAVSKYIEYSDLSSFDKVWKEVLKQVDYFEQGEKGWNNLNKTTYKGAKNWLKSFAHLCNCDIPEEYVVKEVAEYEDSGQS